VKPYAFVGQTAIVTGAASGIGAALAALLAERGSSLALVDQDSPGLERVVAEILAAHPQLTVTAHHADFAEIDDFGMLAAEIRTAHPRIGLLVNNAGVALGGRVDDVSMADIDWIMTINFRSPVALVKQFLPDLRANRGSHITNISSLFGLIAPAGQASYSASKFAIRGFTLALQAELIPAGIGVTVVHPGGIATNIAKNARLGTAGSNNLAAATAARNQISAMLTMPPHVAAGQIVEAIEKRKERLVITRRAIRADHLVRLMPVRQRRIIARSMAR